MPSPRPVAAIWVIVLAIVACGGCNAGERLYPVSGTVTVNGQPAVGAQVTFYPAGQSGVQVVPSTGIVAADGTFTLSTNGKAGAPPGQYEVTIVWPEERKSKTAGKLPEGYIGEMGRSDEGPAADRLQGRYADRQKSPLRATVEPRETKLPPFELK